MSCTNTIRRVGVLNILILSWDQILVIYSLTLEIHCSITKPTKKSQTLMGPWRHLSTRQLLGRSDSCLLSRISYETILQNCISAWVAVKISHQNDTLGWSSISSHNGVFYEADSARFSQFCRRKSRSGPSPWSISKVAGLKGDELSFKPSLNNRLWGLNLSALSKKRIPPSSMVSSSSTQLS